MTWSEDELLAAFREERGPDAKARGRLHARLAEVPGAVDTGSASAPANRWARRGLVAVIALAAAIAGTCALAPHTASEVDADAPALVPDAAEVETVAGRAHASRASGRPQPEAPVPPAPALAPVEPPATDTAQTRAATESPQQPQPRPQRAANGRTRRDTRPAPQPEPSPPTTVLREEAEAIGRARAALAKGSRRTALDRLAAYRLRFPQPLLGEEAAAVRAMAECYGADAAAARESLQAFAKAHPGSLFRKQVERSCVAPSRPTAPGKPSRENTGIPE